MNFQHAIAVAGLRKPSKAMYIRSLPYQGDGKLVDGATVSIEQTGLTCTDVTAESTDFGVVVFGHVGKSGSSDNGKEDAFIKTDVPPVMVEGCIWVRTDEVITEIGKAAKVYVDPTDGTLSAVAEGNIEFKGAYWNQPTNTDGLAVVNLG